MLRKEIQAPLRDPVRFVKTAAIGKSEALMPYHEELLEQLQNQQAAVRLSFQVPRRMLGRDQSK
ncbi:hypothetical protein K3722_07595 [Leisingera caerulea]|uniref:Uncharacterized protein n=1 Tax=Leisingera caerulea TaxID=506591 RepID=A0ABY5X0B6_LEICA|nr:hypothetical protein [Leisingera caerulea]UWQ59985.1 hypothetical protein K3722_07595 [Leisingera caerulea]